MSCPEVLNFLDSVTLKNDLPILGNTFGDVRSVRESGIQYYWSLISGSGTISDWIPINAPLELAASGSILLQTKHSFLVADSSTTSRDPTYVNLMSNTITLTNSISKIRIIFTASFRASTGLGAQFRIRVGSTTYATCAGHTRNSSEAGNTSVNVDIPSLGIGTHTIQIQYCKESTATAGSTLYIRPIAFANIEHAALMLSEVIN